MHEPGDKDRNSLNNSLRLTINLIPEPSNPINPTPGPDVTAPPHVNCEPGWHYLPDPDACFWIDSTERAWDAALDYCRGQAASLASVNSPKRQTELLQLGALDPTATGEEDQSMMVL